MTSAGEILRRERLRKGLDLGDIAQRTRITQKYLEAIEADDLKSLPGGFFYKSFVRQYASALGLDFEELEPQVEVSLEAEAPPLLPGQEPLAPFLPQDPILVAANRRALSERRIGLPVALLVAVLVGCSGIYAWWHKRTQPAPIPVAQIKTEAPVLPTTPVITAVSKTAPTGQDPVVTASDAPSGDGVVLSVSAKERTWLAIFSDGKEIFRGILEPSQTKTLEGKEVAKLRVGNAAGVEIRWNGKEIGPVGEHGQVRIVLFTRDNYQVLKPETL